jgi:integrase
MSSSSFEKVAECLYRNPSSRTYYALVKLGGKQFKQSMKTKYLPEAKRELRAFRASLEVAKPSSGRVTVKSVCKTFRATFQDQSASTRQNKEIMLAKFEDQFGTNLVRGLTKSGVLGWLASLPYSTSWRNQHLRLIRGMLRLAVDDGLIFRSPLEGVKEKKVEKPIRHTPTKEQFQAIVASIRAQSAADTRGESADFVEFLGLAGLGLAEASSLTWADVDFDHSRIITFRHKTRAGFAVPIYPQARPLLENRLALAIKIAGGQPSSGAKVFSVGDPKKAIEAACIRLGFVRLDQEGKKLPLFSSRSFRRLFITTAIERGVDIKTVAAWQGHRDGGKLILDTYSHVRPVHSDKMAALMTLQEPKDAANGGETLSA